MDAALKESPPSVHPAVMNRYRVFRSRVYALRQGQLCYGHRWPNTISAQCERIETAPAIRPSMTDQRKDFSSKGLGEPSRYYLDILLQTVYPCRIQTLYGKSYGFTRHLRTFISTNNYRKQFDGFLSKSRKLIWGI